MQHRVDFESLPWVSPAQGIRQKVYKDGCRQLRLVEYSEEMPPHWCEKARAHRIHLEGKNGNKIPKRSLPIFSRRRRLHTQRTKPQAFREDTDRHSHCDLCGRCLATEGD